MNYNVTYLERKDICTKYKTCNQKHTTSLHRSKVDVEQR